MRITNSLRNASVIFGVLLYGGRADDHKGSRRTGATSGGMGRQSGLVPQCGQTRFPHEKSNVRDPCGVVHDSARQVFAGQSGRRKSGRINRGHRRAFRLFNDCPRHVRLSDRSEPELPPAVVATAPAIWLGR